MLKIKYFTSLVFVALSLPLFSQWDITQTRVLINNGSDVYLAGAINPLADPDLDDYFLGRFSVGGTLTLKGGEIRTEKSASSNFCDSNDKTALYYRVYRLCDTPGSFSSIPFSLSCAAPCPGTYDERWAEISGTTNLLGSLTQSGTYVFEAYWQAEGSSSSNSACDEYITDNNSGDNYIAYFEFDNSDSFSDGNFSSSPVWGGDTGDFIIVEKSDVAGLDGTETVNSHTLRLNAASAGTHYLSTQIADWNKQQEWYFWVGRRNQSATVSNSSYVWLYATESDLTSNTIDGYRLQIGDDYDDDEIRLERVDNGTPTVIFETADIITNGISDWGVAFKIIRDQNGFWTIRTSSLPALTGDGVTALDCPDDNATVLQMNALDYEYEVEDNTYLPAANGYYGVMAVHTSGSDALEAQEFDNFRVVILPENTYINFVASNDGVAENVGGGTYTLTVEITNPSATYATSADVVLISGDDDRIDNYVTQTITFPAGSSADKTVQLTITDNGDCDDVANLVFELQNISGGVNAYAESPDVFNLSVVDDNMGYETLLNEDVEDGNLNGWEMSGAGSWTANSTDPVSDTYSMRHVYSGSAGQSRVYTDMDNAFMQGLTTTWRFNVKMYTVTTTATTNWLVFLSANDPDLWGANVDGYAVGVYPDTLKLWRVDNGVPTSKIVASSLKWTTSQSVVGIQVIRDENGEFSFYYDSNGNFDNLVLIGTGSDNTYKDMGYFGARYKYSASNGGKLALDDIAITQKGCKNTLYSRATGNTTDAIWSTAASGSPSPTTAVLNRYTDLILQSPYTVTMAGDHACQDLTIQSGATLNNGAAKNLLTYGDWTNNGTFVKNTGTVTMKGKVAQTIDGSSTTLFNDWIVDNDYGSVTLSSATEVSGVLKLNEGTLTTGGNLTLVSNSSASGSIGTISSQADISGNVTVQRYVPPALQNWAFLGCPIPNKTIADWADDIITTGFTGSDYPNNTLNNIQHYDETLLGGRNIGWTGATHVTNTLSHVNGYIVYMPAAANTIDVNGNIQKGDVSVPLSFTETPDAGDGWNLVNNVYPSEVDWEAVEGNSSDVATYYVFDSQLPGYRSYNANSKGGSANRFIAHSQSFFVQATETGQTLEFKETDKTNTGASFLRNGPDAQLVRLRIEKGSLADEAVIAFVDGATDNYERKYDAEKWESIVTSSPEFALVTADGKYNTIDAHDLLTDALSIPIYLDLPSSGTYQLVISEVLNIPAGSCITLEDTFTGMTTPVESGSVLTFTSSSPYQGNRMIIHFSAPVSISTTDATCFGNDNGTIGVTLPQGNWSYSILNGWGATVYTSNSSSEWSDAPAGSYVIEVNNADNACGTSTAQVKIAEPQQVVSTLATAIDHCNTSGDGRIELYLSGGDDYAYTLVNSSNEVVAQGQTTENMAMLENLPADIYQVNVATPCGIISQTANLKDPQAIDATILASAWNVQIADGESATVDFSSNTENITAYKWKINGVVVSTEWTFTYNFDTQGVYTISLETSNESCTAVSQTTVSVNTVLAVPAPSQRSPVSLLQINGGVELTFSDGWETSAEVRLFSSTGQLIKHVNAATQHDQKVFIDLRDLSGGVYALQVISGSQLLFSDRVVK